MTEPSAAPARPKGRRWIAWLGILASIVGGYQLGTFLTRREGDLSVELAKTRKLLADSEKRHADVKQKWDLLEKEHAELLELNRQMKEEKVKLLFEAHSSEATLQSQTAALEKERDALSGQVGALSEKNQTLETENNLMDRQLDYLQKTNERLTLQRDTIQRQLAKAEKRSKEREFQRLLLEKQKEILETRKKLQGVQGQTREAQAQAKKTEEELEKIQGRFKQLQQEHLSLVAEAADLRVQANRTPTDITRMARQHERLIGETASMHYNLGVMHSQQKRYAEAAREFQKVIELKPDDADSYYNLGVIYAEHLPNREKALAHFRKYLKLNPKAQDADWVKQYIATWQAWEAKERLE